MLGAPQTRGRRRENSVSFIFTTACYLMSCWVLSPTVSILNDTFIYVHHLYRKTTYYTNSQRRGPPDRSPTDQMHPRSTRTDRFVTAIDELWGCGSGAGRISGVGPHSGCEETGMIVLVSLVHFAGYIDQGNAEVGRTGYCLPRGTWFVQIIRCVGDGQGFGLAYTLVSS